MFRDTKRKRLRNRVVFASLGVAVLTFGIWLNYQDDPEEMPAQDAVQEVEVETEAEEQPTEKDEAEKQDPAEKEQEGTDTGLLPETYLIKEVDGVVKVFVCDEEGNKELYLITSIPFDLLSESDQQLFIDGVELDTEDDLGKFLENFDS